MRDLVFLLAFIGFTPLILMRPHIGVMLWGWSAILVPNSFLYGFMLAFPFSKFIAGLTLVSLVFSSEPKKIPINTTTLVMLLIFFWGTISMLLAPEDNFFVWEEWNKFWKIILFGLLVCALINTRERIHAMLFMLVAALAIHTINQVWLYISYGGGHHIYGPGTSIIANNNQFATVIVMNIPILIYLLKYTKNHFVKCGLLGTLLVSFVAVLGTQSRGGLMALLGMGVWLLIVTKRKLLLLVILIPLGGILFSYAVGENWINRMATISSLDEDLSFMGRITAWKIAALIGLDNPGFGAGFRAIVSPDIWSYHIHFIDRFDFIPSPFPDPQTPKDYHSMYFQVLGDLGFVGLFMFIIFWVSNWRNGRIVRSRLKNISEMNWAKDVSLMLQCSFMGYFVAGLVQSIAYFDLVVCMAGILVNLRLLSSSIQTTVTKEAGKLDVSSS